MEYDLLQDIDIPTLRNRLVLLHHFSDLFCPMTAMFDLVTTDVRDLVPSGQHALTPPSIDSNKLRGILVSSSKEAAFRKVVQTTMVRDKQHGPVIELNRIQVSGEVFIFIHLNSNWV